MFSLSSSPNPHHLFFHSVKRLQPTSTVSLYSFISLLFCLFIRSCQPITLLFLFFSSSCQAKTFPADKQPLFYPSRLPIFFTSRSFANLTSSPARNNRLRSSCRTTIHLATPSIATIKMASNIEVSLDEMLSNQRKTSGRRRSTRRSSGPAKPAPAGGIQKSTRPPRGNATKAAPSKPSGMVGESKIVVSNLVCTIPPLEEYRISPSSSMC